MDNFEHEELLGGVDLEDSVRDLVDAVKTNETVQCQAVAASRPIVGLLDSAPRPITLKL